MDLNNVIDRAVFHGELLRRFGTQITPGRRPRLDPHLAGACSLLDTAMRSYDPANADVLVRAAVDAHRRYTASGALRTSGFLSFLFREIAPERRWDSYESLPAHVEWAVRVVECVRAGLGDEDFSRLIEGLGETLTELADDEPVMVS
ncbi:MULTISPECIES: hypothetical protein [unclassified Streptomyces]|uniref:hypothetical protein n=1 Tax=unclassified Streptomyces TaxID=2593676 RepID=UPI000B833F83|nr:MULTISPECIES: hypothetical protein [unclassified Streptomyces]